MAEPKILVDDLAMILNVKEFKIPQDTRADIMTEIGKLLQMYELDKEKNAKPKVKTKDFVFTICDTEDQYAVASELSHFIVKVPEDLTHIEARDYVNKALRTAESEQKKSNYTKASALLKLVKPTKIVIDEKKNEFLRISKKILESVAISNDVV